MADAEFTTDAEVTADVDFHWFIPTLFVWAAGRRLESGLVFSIPFPTVLPPSTPHSQLPAFVPNFCSIPLINSKLFLAWIAVTFALD
jgi:hypothetical protein